MTGGGGGGTKPPPITHLAPHPPTTLSTHREVGGGRAPRLPRSDPEGSSHGESPFGSHVGLPPLSEKPRMSGLFGDEPEEEPPPPPPEGPGLFGDAPAAPEPVHATPYRVLARKYRPTTFDDLIGQESMVRILRNAFAAGRVAHAFMLTGVRGVGKTTTARIIARALNCTGPDGNGGPTADPCAVVMMPSACAIA